MNDPLVQRCNIVLFARELTQLIIFVCDYKKRISQVHTNSQHWKLQPEVQKRINVLIARLGIVEKDIPTLPDLASVVLHPSKGLVLDLVLLLSYRDKLLSLVRL